MRAMVSELLPAWNGTIRRIGRSVGQPCAPAGPDDRAMAKRAKMNLITRKVPADDFLVSLAKRHASRHPRPIASGDLISLAQALDQGGAEQEGARKLRVFRSPAQLLVVLLAYRRILLCQHALVADGLGLGVLERDMAALPFVAIEHLVAHLLAQDPDQLVGEIDGVMNAAVHAHRADRAVHMRGIAGKDGATNAELAGDTLVHGIEIAADDIVVASPRQESLQPRLQRLWPLQRFGIVLWRRWKVHAPAVGRALPVKQVRPFVRVGDVVSLGVAVLAEIVGDLDVERAVRIGEALELDAEVLADDAAGAFTAHDIAALDDLLFAGRIADAGDHAVGVLLEGVEGRAQAKVDQRMRLCHLQRFLDDLDALALQNVGKAGVVLQMDVVERGDQLVLVAVPKVEDGRDDPARLDLRVKTDAIEHFERGGMVGVGTGHLLQEVIVAEGFDQRHRNVVLSEREREAQPNRAGADDDDAIGLVHSCSSAAELLAALTTSPRRPWWRQSSHCASGRTRCRVDRGTWPHNRSSASSAGLQDRSRQ